MYYKIPPTMNFCTNHYITIHLMTCQWYSIVATFCDFLGSSAFFVLVVGHLYY